MHAREIAGVEVAIVRDGDRLLVRIAGETMSPEEIHALRPGADWCRTVEIGPFVFDEPGLAELKAFVQSHERVDRMVGDVAVPEQQSVSAPWPPAGALFRSTQAGASPGQRARYSADVLRALRSEFKIGVVGHLHGEPLVRLDVHPHDYTTWYLCDNGGELNVGPVNRDVEMRPVAYRARGTSLDAGTVAYRVAAVLRGEEIDYDLRRPELVGG